MTEKMTNGDENSELAAENKMSGTGKDGDSESDDEGPKVTNRRVKKRIIDSDDDDDDNDDNGRYPIRHEADSEAEAIFTSEPRNSQKTVGVKEALRAVLNDSESSDGSGADPKGNTAEADGDESSQSSDNSRPNSPLCLANKDLFDADDSSEEDRDLDTAAGPEYNSAEDEDYDVSSLDPKLLNKLKKIKGAAKNKPREQKSRKCKPSKDDLLQLHSDSQRLIRESQVNLPYHKPAPKSLQDFLQRSKKKQEVYSSLKGARDIEKAIVIQEKIAESSIVPLPKLRHPNAHHREKVSRRSSGKSHLHQSQEDSGITSGLSQETQNQVKSESACSQSDALSASSGPLCSLDDELPDLEMDSHSDGLFESQHTLKEGGTVTKSSSQELSQTISHLGSENFGSSQCCQENAGKAKSQALSDDEACVEEFDSPVEESQDESQHIEDSESLLVKGCDSQRSESGTMVDSLPDSLEINECSEKMNCDEKDSVISETPAAFSAKAAEEEKLEDPNMINNDINRLSLKVSETPHTAIGIHHVADAGETSRSIQAARKKALEELSHKGIVPAIGRGHDKLIVLDDPSTLGKRDNIRSKGVQALMERLIKQHQKNLPKKITEAVQINIVEKTGGEVGQEKELQLSTVTYRPDKVKEDLETANNIPGGSLEALKRKLEVGMQQKRAVAYERRKQLYKMENEEGYDGEAADGLPAEEDEMEMTDQSDTDVEEDADEEEDEDVVELKENNREWNNPFLDDEADEDDEDEEENEDIPQRPVCAEIDDKEDDEDLFQDSESLHLRLEVSDDDDDDEKEDSKKEDEDDEELTVPVRKAKLHSQRPVISDDEESQPEVPSAQLSLDETEEEAVMQSGRDRSRLYSEEDSQIPPAQDPSKECLPEHRIDWKRERMVGHKQSIGDRLGLDGSFELLTPMTLLLQDTQPSRLNKTMLSQPIEDSQDLCCGSDSEHNSSAVRNSSDEASQLDHLGYLRSQTTQRATACKSGGLQESSQEDAGDILEMMSGKFLQDGSQMMSQDDDGVLQMMSGKFVQENSQEDPFDDEDQIMGLLSGQFTDSQDGAQSTEDRPVSGSFAVSERFGAALFDKSQSQTSSDARSLISLFDSSSQSQDSFGKCSDELLGLCSGKFVSQAQNHSLSSLSAVPFNKPQSLLNQKIAQSQTMPRCQSTPKDQDKNELTERAEITNSGEVVKLSSEVNGSKLSPNEKLETNQISKNVSVKCGVKRRLVIHPSDSSDDEVENGTGPFQILSDNEGAEDSDEKEVLSDSDEENSKDEEIGDDVEENDATFRGFKSKGRVLQQFVDNEAELSGSEAESDEDLDIAEEDDYLEMEEGDNDVTLNEEQLRDQVGRVHMKQLLDDDDKELMRYKEMYLPDGDLHSDGAGRLRRFQWKNMGDEASQPDIFADGSDEETEAAEDPDEKRWRMERYEREKFLESQHTEVADDTNDNSQLLKFGKFFMKRQASESSLPVVPPLPTPKEHEQPSVIKPKGGVFRTQSMPESASPGTFIKPKVPKRGSFLCRSKENLAKIAEITKSSTVSLSSDRNARGFVFSVGSADKGGEEVADGPEGEKLLASMALTKKRVGAVHRPPTKKRCLEPTPKPGKQTSIFRLLDT